MRENTIVVGGNVQGNISSCDYKTTHLITGRPNLFVIEKEAISYNQCTGNVIKTNYWEIADGGVLVVLFGAFFIVFICAIIIDSRR